MANKRGEQPGGSSGPSQLSREAQSALDGFTEKLHAILLDTASQKASGRQLTGSDVEAAYEELVGLGGIKRIQAVISTALRENRIFEYATYLMIFALFGWGIFLVYTGLTRPDDVARVPSLVGGAVVQVLILPALRYAIHVRRHNISIRMIGALLEGNEDPRVAAETINDLLKRLLDGGA